MIECVEARELEHVRLVILWLAKLLKSRERPSELWHTAYNRICSQANEAVRRLYGGLGVLKFPVL